MLTAVACSKSRRIFNIKYGEHLAVVDLRAYWHNWGKDDGIFPEIPSQLCFLGTDAGSKSADFPFPSLFFFHLFPHQNSFLPQEFRLR
jgi:hypothetical protein